LRLGQILINLLGNAVKFTERGRIVLEVARAGDQIAFSVIDSGVGIAEDDLARLFTPFEQIDPSSSRSHGGSGLGLAISRNLAQMMGGTLAATSEPGVGSRFELRLPLPARSAPLAPAVPAAASERSAARLVGLHLLVVDDVEVNRLIVEDLLAQEGASAVSVADGASAVAAACAADAAFDAVLMDIQMPGMDGYEAARLIRAQRPSLPVIGLTAHAMADDSGTEGASALAARLPKPLESERLVAELSRLGGADGDGSDASHPRPAARERLASAGAAGAGGSAAEQVRAGATAAVGQAEAENAASASVIDWAALEARFAASPGFVARVIDTALRSAADAPAELRRLAADGDLDGFYRSSHGIKGLAGNLSAESLYQLADELCEAAQRGDRSVLARGEGFAVEVERLLRALADRRQSRGDGEGSPG
jgi:CheY-like chemotaxis protein/HPt (histidine-containing phosphotransfer) domain-containing protein